MVYHLGMGSAAEGLLYTASSMDVWQFYDYIYIYIYIYILQDL